MFVSKNVSVYKKPFPLKGVPKREFILRVSVYGIPITIGFLGVFLGWWEKLRQRPVAGTDLLHDAKQLRQFCSGKFHLGTGLHLAHNDRDVISRG